MERVRAQVRRRFTHLCPAQQGRFVQISQEICPDCGQTGEFGGFFRGIFYRMAQQHQLYGFPVSGPQITFLPKMRRECERCAGEGVVRGDDFDYECPDCAWTGGFLILTEAEMQKIQRWALARHERARVEHANPKPKRARKTRVQPLPNNPIFTRDLEGFIGAFMTLHEYHVKYDERNDQIGARVLPCDAWGWDVFMEMIETWENLGRGLAVTEDAVLLTASPLPESATLISLHPPSAAVAQHIQINRAAIAQVLGPRRERALWKKIAGFLPTPEGWLAVDGRMTLYDAREWILKFPEVEET